MPLATAKANQMAVRLWVHKSKFVGRGAAPRIKPGDKPQLLQTRKSSVHSSYAQLGALRPGTPVDLFGGQGPALVTP